MFQDGSKDIFGKFSYIRSTVKTLLNPVKFDFSLTVDGETKENTSMMLIANGPNIGGGQIPQPTYRHKMEEQTHLYLMIKH